MRHIASFRCTAVFWFRGVTPSGHSIASSRCRVASFPAVVSLCRGHGGIATRVRGRGRAGRRDTSARPRGTGGCQTPPAAPAGWDGTGQPEEPCPPGPGAAKSSARWQRSGTDPLFLAGTPLLFAGVSFSPASACWKLAPAGGPVCARILASPARPFLSGFYPWGIFCDACVVHSG